MRFTKMQGAGNDFIIIDNTVEHLTAEQMPLAAKRLCARRTSIGADGMMFVDKAEQGGDFSMHFYNLDGSLGEMCGNGARCIARYGFEKGFAKGDTVRVETTAGMVEGVRITKREYRIRLNDPTVLEAHRPVTALGRTWDTAYAELGNPGLPHAVLVYEGYEGPDCCPGLRELGSALRHGEAFPKGANASFVKVIGEDDVLAATFERGVEDFTLACGTGAGSITALLTMRGLVSGQNVRIRMPGGDLYVDLVRDGESITGIYLTGPTNIVAEGEILDEEFEVC